MADAEGIREAKHPSGQMGSQPRDLLQRFIHGRNNFSEKKGTRKEDEEEIELSLGLSLNGRFGVDPERTKNLIRSSSISNLMMISKESRGVCLDAGGGANGALTRTCSLPVETEEDWRKRKEVQSQRRMEAKRKRLERIKNVRVVRGRSDSEENGRVGLVVPIKNGELSTPIGAESKGEKGSGGSIASQGSGGSSGVSDPESQPTQLTGTNLVRVHSLPPQVGQKPIPSRGSPTREAGGDVVENSSPNKVTVAHKNGNESVKGMMVDMPCVCTRGDGPNGKTIEGFLYRYRKGEEVKIVCVCHGSFLSPAEFVKHAGGGDVAHPLRHIVVCNSPSPFL